LTLRHLHGARMRGYSNGTIIGDGALILIEEFKIQLMDPLTMGRRRFEEEEIRELRRGLLLRMRELLDEGADLNAAELAYALFSRLGSGVKGRPRGAKVDWDFINYVVDSFL